MKTFPAKLAAALITLGFGYLFFAPLANAHTPHASLSCNAWSLRAKDYNPAEHNTYSYSLDGATAITGSFSTKFHRGGTVTGLDKHTLVAHVWQNDDPSARYSKSYSLKVRGCGNTTSPTPTPTPTSSTSASPSPTGTVTPTPTSSVPTSPSASVSSSKHPTMTPSNAKPTKTKTHTSVIGKPSITPTNAAPSSSTSAVAVPVDSNKPVPASLSSTGAKTGQMLVIGAGLLIVGALVLYLARRPKPQRN